MRVDAMNLDGLIDALERAELHGHGGAFFPTATKLRAVATAPGRKRPVVVVNGSEGEPLSRKDRFLLGSRTDTVIDGVLLTAGALGADTIVIAIDERRRATIDAVRAALAERAELGGRRAPAAEVVAVPEGYVTGQETALLSALAGRPAKPTAAPPYPFEKGLRGAPTLVSNVETFAQIARVADGTFDASRYVTVSGAVDTAAVIRVRPSSTVGGALTAAGGITDHVSAVLLGGYAGTWVATPEALEVPLDERALRARGLTLGAGIVHALGASRCGVAEVARVTRWMARQSAGQCGPCVFGLAAIAGALEGLCGVGASELRGEDALAQIERWNTMVTRRGACAHPDGVARYVSTALVAMASEFAGHAADGPCERCASTLSPGAAGRTAQLSRSAGHGTEAPVAA